MRKLPLLLLVVGSLTFAQEVKTPQQLYDEATSAYKRGDMKAYLGSMEQLHAMRPAQPIIALNYAGALALNHREEESVRELGRLAAMQTTWDLTDRDFDSLRARDDFKAIEKTMKELATKRISSGTVAYKLPKDIITESITYDPVTRRLFVSGVRERKIIAIDRKGKISDFIKPAQDGLWGVNGMGVDARRRVLWASSSAYARSLGYDASHDGEKALYAFDLDSGALKGRYEPPPIDKLTLDDLSVGPDGTVYLSDARGSLLRLKPGAKTLETFVPRGSIRSAQGSTVSPDGKTLYVSDYGGAIDAVDLASAKVTRLEIPSDFPMYGIDGLAYYDGTLLAVQNGVAPNRVVRLWLDPSAPRITRWKILEMNHPLMDEPTIGVVAGRDYYVNISSQGNKFDRKQTEKLHDSAVLKIHF